MKVIESRPVTFVEAEKILEEKKKSEMAYEQKITVDYLRKFVQIGEKEVELAKKELKEAIDDLKDHQIVMLINLLPETDEEVEVLFVKERLNLTKDQVKKILEVLDKIRIKKK